MTYMSNKPPSIKYHQNQKQQITLVLHSELRVRAKWASFAHTISLSLH